MKETVVLKTDLKGLKLLGRGKVRDIYKVDDKLLLVASDRLSAFDVVMPDGPAIAGGVRGSRLPLRVGLGRVQGEGRGLWHLPTEGDARVGSASRADFHAGNQGGAGTA